MTRGRIQIRAIARKRWTASVAIGLLYVFIMPAAALLYTSFGPGSFYDNNLEREPSHATDTMHVDTLLAAAVELNAAHRPVLSTKLGTRSGVITVPLAFAPDTIRASDLSFPDGNPNFDVTGELVSVTSIGYIERFALRVEILAPVDLLPHSTALAVTVQALPAGAAANQDALFGALFTKSPIGRYAQGYAGMLLHPQLLDALQGFYGASVGDPLSQSDQFARMLYFSASAATTVGFGDITPVTTTARTWVTIEVILEIVLIGVFLASLAAVRQK